MQITHHPKAKVANIRLRERTRDIETLRIASDFHVDIDSTGAACGIELVDAYDQLGVGMLMISGVDSNSHCLGAT